MNDFKDYKLDFQNRIAVFALCFLVVFFSLRGWFVLTLNIPTSIVYPLSSMFMMGMSCYSFINTQIFKDNNLLFLKKIFLVNIFFGMYFFFTEAILGIFDISLFYIFIAPYLFFLFIRIPIIYLKGSIFIIASGISYSILQNYYNVVTGSGYEYISQYNMMLRPELGEFNVSTSGDFIRIGGYTGSYHDSAQILGMITSFLYTYFLINKTVKYLALSIITFFCLLLTLSAANILITIFCCVLATFYFLSLKKSLVVYVFVILCFFTFYIASQYFPILTAFVDRLNTQDTEGMYNGLSLDMFGSLFFWIGHGYPFNSEFLITEVAFIKCFHQFGLVTSLLIFTLLFYPIWFYFRNPRILLTSLPYLAPIVFGFLSLLHYGSLFKITNIAVFYLFYALFFKLSLNKLFYEKYKL